MRLPSTATLEAVVLCAVATVVFVRQETITQTWMRARQHPLGLLAGGALTGIGVAHIWMEDPVLRQLVRGDANESPCRLARGVADAEGGTDAP